MTHYHDSVVPPGFVMRVNELLENPPAPLERVVIKVDKRAKKRQESAKDKAIAGWAHGRSKKAKRSKK